MNAEKLINRLYNFFVGFGIFVFIGTLVEISALHHTHEAIQFVPFVLLPLGIILGIILLLKPGKALRQAALIGMWIIAVGGLGGMLVHVSGNLEEVFHGGGSSLLQILQDAIGGRNPLLAPGTLTIGAAMILAVMYARKSLESKK